MKVIKMGFPRFITTECCKCGKRVRIPETIWGTRIIKRGMKFICNDCRDKGKFESNYIDACDA